MNKKIIIGIVVVILIVIGVGAYMYFKPASLVEEMPKTCTGDEIFDTQTGDLCPGKVAPKPPVYFDKE